MLRRWEDYLQELKSGGDLIKRTWRPNDAQYRADLYKQLMMNISYAYFQYFQSDARHPDFMPLWNSVFMLQPNPDDCYLYAPLQGDLRYRVVGDRGTIHRISFRVGHDMIGMTDTPGPGLDYFDLTADMVGSDGKIDLVLSAERPEGHKGAWRYLDPRADYLIVRQRSYDWGGEVDSRFAIECLDAPERKRQLSPDDIADILDKMVKLPERWSALWIDWQNDLLKSLGKNRFELNTFGELAGVANQFYWQAIFDFAPGEALIVETELPDVRPYWNVQVNDPIFNAVEYVYRQSSLNGHTARVDSDGRFRAVLCQDDPGVPNWLDACGYWQGTIIGRWTECGSAPVPTLKKVPFSEIRAHLPADTSHVTEEQRGETLRARRLGAQLRRRW